MPFVFFYFSLTALRWGLVSSKINSSTGSKDEENSCISIRMNGEKGFLLAKVRGGNTWLSPPPSFSPSGLWPESWGPGLDQEKPYISKQGKWERRPLWYEGYGGNPCFFLSPLCPSVGPSQLLQLWKAVRTPRKTSYFWQEGQEEGSLQNREHQMNIKKSCRRGPPNSMHKPT